MEREEIREIIWNLGSDHKIFFDNVGGIYLQQDPDELADLIYYLMNTGKKYDSYLEIGAASGGTVYIMNYFLKFNITYTIDINVHPRTHLRKDITKGINYVDLYASSHDTEVKELLKSNNIMFDIILIDGDHTHHGVRQDRDEYNQFLKPGGFMIFHDVCVTDLGVVECVDEFKTNKNYTFIKTFGTRFGLAAFKKN